MSSLLNVSLLLLISPGVVVVTFGVLIVKRILIIVNFSRGCGSYGCGGGGGGGCGSCGKKKKREALQKMIDAYQNKTEE